MAAMTVLDKAMQITFVWHVWPHDQHGVGRWELQKPTAIPAPIAMGARLLGVMFKWEPKDPVHFWL